MTYQDSGRLGLMRFGVPASGPMDRLSHAVANKVLRNPVDATAIEVSLGGLTLECVSGVVTVAITGGHFLVDHAGEASSGWNVMTVRAGERLSIRPGSNGSWAYLAFAGRVDASAWLDRTATHSTSGLGGGPLTAGDEVRVSDSRVNPERIGEIPRPSSTAAADEVRVVMGPQDHHFTDAARRWFGTSTYSLSDAYDRMGVRLEGPTLGLRDALSIPSEPIVRGSVQVAGDGVATVLLADHQTTGGYPKIATVITPDLDALAQRRAGDSIRFRSVTSEDAIVAARAQAEFSSAYLEAMDRPGRTLAHRLMQENLISGAVHPEE